MPSKLTGIKPLAYQGVQPSQPPNIVELTRQPTINDYYEFNEGDFWMVKRAPTLAIPNELWYLARKTGTVLGVEAHWRQLYPSSGGAGGGNLMSDDGVISVPDPGTGAINVLGGNPYVVGSDPWLGNAAYVNIYTVQNPDAYTLEVVLKRSINQPLTNVTATEGMYSLGQVNFMHAYGSDNTFLGLGSTDIASMDAALATDNTIIGASAGAAISTGSNITALGSSAVHNTTVGNYIIGIGAGAGSAINNDDSSLILIGAPGTPTEDNAIHIGIGGVGDGQQDKCYIPAVWEGVADPGLLTGLTLVNSAGKLYVDIIAPNSVLMTDAFANPIGIKGDVGTVFTGRGLAPADPAPEFLPIESAGGTVTISTNPISGAINLEAAGVAGLITLTADTGVVLPNVGNINVFGGDLINTDNLVANTVTVNVVRGLVGEIISGTGIGSAAIYKQLYCSDGSVIIDFATDPTKIDVKVVGVPPVGGINYLMDHALLHVPPTAFGIQIEQGANITTVGDVPTSKITISVTDSVELPLGHMYARDDIKTTAGSLIADAGHLSLPNTDAVGTGGTIKFNSRRTIHNYGDIVNNYNIYVGYRSGNITLTPNTAVGNTGIGALTLESLTTSAYNTAGGWSSLNSLTSGTGRNTAYGVNSLPNLVSGVYNTAYGWMSGSNLAGSESHNVYVRNSGVLGDDRCIRIGTPGLVNGGQTDCYIAGIRGSTDGPNLEMVVISDGHKLSSMTVPASAAHSFVTDSGTATVIGTTLQIKGGYNINTSGATNIVTVNLDGSIQQNNTTAAGDGIYALGTRGATNYAANRFMHNFGSNSTYLGNQAGPISGAGGTNLIGIGDNALDASNNTCIGSIAIGVNSMTRAATSNYCTCVGDNSGTYLSTGDYNILIGNSTGYVYTTEAQNIIIGGAFGGIYNDAANVGDASVIRLGYEDIWSVPAPTPHDPDPVFTRTQQGTLKTYVYGIFGTNNLDESASPVYVDKYGQLGTEGGVLFAFRQTTALPNITGDGTVYLFGTSGGLTEDFDNTNSLTLGGGGTAAYFTAKYSGKYAFISTITMSVPASPVVPRPVAVDPLYLFTDQLSYCYSNYMPASTTFIQYVSEVVTTVTYLNAGDHVRWGCAAGIPAQAKNIGIVNATTVTAPAPVGTKTCYATYFTGYRIS